MKVFDFNVHLPYEKYQSVNSLIEHDLNLSVNDILQGLEMHSSIINQLDGANFLLFNTTLLTQDITPFSQKISQILSKSSCTALIDFRRLDLITYLEKVKEARVKAIMFNSYLQNIAETDFTEVYKACRFAEENKLIICIDGSFGTSKMYSYDNLKLACYISDLVSKVPIVIVHSGGYRILEAMLLALEKPNVWLDTSFSLPYYIGSSLEKDFAFAYKKIGTNRILYGSDNPYENSKSAKKIHLDFFEKYSFTTSEIERMFYNNSLNLFSL